MGSSLKQTNESFRIQASFTRVIRGIHRGIHLHRLISKLQSVWPLSSNSIFWWPCTLEELALYNFLLLCLSSMFLFLVTFLLNITASSNEFQSLIDAMIKSVLLLLFPSRLYNFEFVRVSAGESIVCNLHSVRNCRVKKCSKFWILLWRVQIKFFTL